MRRAWPLRVQDKLMVIVLKDMVNLRGHFQLNFANFVLSLSGFSPTWSVKHVCCGFLPAAPPPTSQHRSSASPEGWPQAITRWSLTEGGELPVGQTGRPGKPLEAHDLTHPWFSQGALTKLASSTQSRILWKADFDSFSCALYDLYLTCISQFLFEGSHHLLLFLPGFGLLLESLPSTFQGRGVGGLRDLSQADFGSAGGPSSHLGFTPHCFSFLHPSY